MANDLLVPEKGSIPAYLLKPEYARQANEEALAGISTGAPPRVKLAGKQFALVDGNGQETPFLPAKLTAGPDGNLYLPLIILRARPAIQKTFYLGAYNPSAEAQAPDCFSNDGITPAADCSAPQCDLCAACPNNAFGSGKDQAGNPTAGKACTDSKILAVFVPKHGVHQFKLPPASLKNFGIYVKQLSAAGLPLGNVITYVGFDMAASFPILVFRFGDYVAEALLPKLAELASSLEAEEIIKGMISGGKKAAAVQAPVKPAPVAQGAVDLGLGDTQAPTTEKKKSRPAKPAAPVVVEEAEEAEETPVAAAPSQQVSDDALRAALGL